MDPYILQVMIFVIVILVVVGGFAMLFPLTRQLTAILEKRYLDDGAEGSNADEVAALRRAVHALRGEVEQIGERQDFTEKLLERPKSED
jgi:hypothetical protein